MTFGRHVRDVAGDDVSEARRHKVRDGNLMVAGGQLDSDTGSHAGNVLLDSVV